MKYTSRPSHEIAAAMIARHDIWHSLFAPAMELAHTTPGQDYADIIVTREARRAPISAGLLARLDWLMGRGVQS